MELPLQFQFWFDVVGMEVASVGLAELLPSRSYVREVSGVAGQFQGRLINAGNEKVRIAVSLEVPVVGKCERNWGLAWAVAVADSFRFDINLWLQALDSVWLMTFEASGA